LKEKIIRKKFKSDPKVLPRIEEFFLNTLRGVNLPEEKFQKLVLAISEAASNAIKHGNKSDPEKYVNTVIKIYSDKVEIILTDEGKGFNPNTVPDPTSTENIMKESGRGIHIMKAFVDELKYYFTDRGTKTCLIVKINEKKS